MTRAGEREVVKVEHVNGGAGFIMKEGLLNQGELGEHCKMFSKVTLPPNCELGHHEHHGETETYYILSGNGMMTMVKPCRRQRGMSSSARTAMDMESRTLGLKT